VNKDDFWKDQIEPELCNEGGGGGREPYS
jgi:hypothetical protein